MMNSNQMVSLLKTLLEDELTEKSRVRTYAEEGLLTRDEGLVVKLPDGNEFQITIVKPKFSKEDE